MDPVSSAESLFAGVCQQALGFCSDKDGDGVIELGEGCLIVRSFDFWFDQSWLDF
jgi:hypothetical protein